MASKSNVEYIRYYTVGTAARVLEVPVREKPKTAPKPRKAKPILLYVDPVAIFGIVTAVFMLVCFAIGLAQWNEACAQQRSMVNYVHGLAEQNAELTDTYHAGYDLQEVEKTALALGMVPADQVQHISISVGE